MRGGGGGQGDRTPGGRAGCGCSSMPGGLLGVVARREVERDRRRERGRETLRERGRGREREGEREREGRREGEGGREGERVKKGGREPVEPGEVAVDRLLEALRRGVRHHLCPANRVSFPGPIRRALVRVSGPGYSLSASEVRARETEPRADIPDEARKRFRRARGRPQCGGGLHCPWVCRGGGGPSVMGSAR